MALRWHEYGNVVEQQATTTRQKAESALDWLTRQQRLRREQAEEVETPAEQAGRQKLEYLKGLSRSKAADEIDAMNKVLAEYGQRPIDVSESNIKKQIMSGHTWTNSLIKQLEVETQQAQEQAETKLRAKIVGDLLKDELITYDTDPDVIESLVQQKTAEYYLEEAFKEGDYSRVQEYRDLLEQYRTGVPTVELPSTIPEEGVGIEEGITVMPDYSVVSGNRTIGKIDPETGEFIEKEPAWWEKMGNILRWLPPNIPATLIQKYGFAAIEKADLPFMIQEQAHSLDEKQKVGQNLTETEQAFIDIYKDEVGDPPDYNEILAALHPAIRPAQMWKGAELSPSEELKAAYYESTGVGSRILHGIATPLTVAFFTTMGLGGATAAQARLARVAARPGVTGVAGKAAQMVTAPLVGYEWAAGQLISKTVGGAYRTVMTSVLKRNLRSWATSVGIEIPTETEKTFIRWALANLEPKFMAKEAIKTLFKPVKGGHTITDAGVRAAEEAAAQAVRTSPLLLGITKAPAPGAVLPKVPVTGKVPPEAVKPTAVAEEVTRIKVGDEVAVRNVYTGEVVESGRVTKIVEGEGKNIFQGKPVVKNYYEIEGKGLYGEEIVEKVAIPKAETVALAEVETITGEIPGGEVVLDMGGMSTTELHKIRQDIMAAGKIKGLSKTSLTKTFKEIVGRSPGDRQLPYSLTEMTDEQLRDTLEIIKTARPVRIGTKIVIRPSTEKKIQSLKQSLINEGKLTEVTFNDMVEQLKLPTTRYETAKKFITEKEGKALIRMMNDEAEIGLIQRQAEATKALGQNPTVKATYDEYSKRIEKQGQVYFEGKPADASILKDMRFAMEDLQVRTGKPFYDTYFALNRAKNANHTYLHDAKQRIIASTPEYNKLVTNKASMGRVRNYIAAKNKWAEVKSPKDITPEEIKLANAYEKELLALQPDFRYHRFLHHYHTTEGNAAKMQEHIPDAPKDELRAAINIYESQGAARLKAYLDTQTWGIIGSGYEPHYVVSPQLAMRKLRTAFPTRRLEPRSGVEFYPEDITIDHAVSRYVRQVRSYNLRPYIRKLERIYAESIPQLKNPLKINRGLTVMSNEMLGYKDRSFFGELVLKAASQAYITVFGTFPTLPFRNLFQNLAHHPDKSALIDPRNRKLTEWDWQFYDTHVSQMRGIEKDLLLAEEGGLPGFRRINRFILRLNLYGASDNKINRIWSYWGSLNKAERALVQYKKDGNIDKFISSSGMAGLTLTQQKQVLENLVMDRVTIPGLPPTSGGNAAITETATEITNNVHLMYDRAQRAWIEMGETGRLVGSLVVFPRSVLQRAIIQAKVLDPKDWSPLPKKKRAFKVLFSLLWGSLAANYLFQKATGRKDAPYNPLNVLKWSPGGLTVGAVSNLAEVAGLLFMAMGGSDWAKGQIPSAVTQTSDTFIPYYKVVMQALEAAADKKQIDRQLYRELRSIIEKSLWEMGFLDKKGDVYEPNRSFYEAERSWEWKMKHALFGTEPEE